MAGALSLLKGRLRKPVIGLDVGTDSIKAVEINGSTSGISIARSAVVPVTGGARGEQSTDDVISALQRLMREHKFSTKRVATAVAGEAVIVRILRLPTMKGSSTEEVRMAVQSEAQDFIPFDMDEVVFDHQMLGEVADSDSPTSEVLIVAVRKDVIDHLLGILDEVGLEPAVIDVSSFALSNTLAFGGACNGNDVVALVSIGATTTSIAVIRNGMTRFTRDLTTAGRTITAAIAGELGISYKEAEQLKLKYGIVMEDDMESAGFSMDAFPDEPSESISHDPLENLYEVPADDVGLPADDAGSGIGSVDVTSIYGDVPDGSSGAQAVGPSMSGVEGSFGDENRERDVVSEICAHYLNEITSEVKRSFIYYENQLDGEPVSKVILCGGTSQMPNATQYLSGILDVPIERMPSMAGVNWGAAGDTETTRSIYGVSVGLALRGLLE